MRCKKRYENEAKGKQEEEEEEEEVKKAIVGFLFGNNRRWCGVKFTRILLVKVQWQLKRLVCFYS
jgi:hypothetical protein